MHRTLRFALTVLLCAGAATGCGKKRATSEPTPAAPATSAPALAEVTLALNWFPEAEHGGFYAADVHGYFKEEGLKVTILSGGPGVPVIPRLASGKVDFAVENADNVVLARAQEAKVKAVMAPIQISPRCIMVHEDSEIMKLHQLKDLTLAMNAGSPFAHYIKANVPLEGVEIVPYGGNVSQFLVNRNYAQQGYTFSEPYVAATRGGKVRSLLVSDIGYNPYTSCLLATDKLIAERPEIVRAMVHASIRGWASYLEDPEPANKAINALNPEMSMETLAYGADAIKPLAGAVDDVGRMTVERWTALCAQLVAIKLVEPKSVDPASTYSLDFLE